MGLDQTLWLMVWVVLQMLAIRETEGMFSTMFVTSLSVRILLLILMSSWMCFCPTIPVSSSHTCMYLLNSYQLMLETKGEHLTSRFPLMPPASCIIKNVINILRLQLYCSFIAPPPWSSLFPTRSSQLNYFPLLLFICQPRSLFSFRFVSRMELIISLLDLHSFIIFSFSPIDKSYK